jgi:AcrR family transcriptional regulator
VSCMLRVGISRPEQRKAFASRRRDPIAKREAVLRTAAHLFLQQSYSRTSLQDVADRLGITKPALYHYFLNKEEILLECFRRGRGLIESHLHDIAVHPGTGLEKVEVFIRSYVNVMTEDFGGCVIQMEEGELSKGFKAEVRRYKEDTNRGLRGLIQGGIEDGSITPCDPQIAALSIIGAMNWIGMWQERGEALSAEEVASQCARTLTQGLARSKPRTFEARA